MEFATPYNRKNVVRGESANGKSCVDKYAFVPLADSICNMVMAGVVRDANTRAIYDLEGESYDEDVLCKPRYGLDPVDLTRMYDTIRRRRERKTSAETVARTSADSVEVKDGEV